MATFADLDAQIATLLAGLPSSPLRVGVDLRDDLERIPSGATRFAQRVSGLRLDEEEDSNAPLETAAVSVALFHRLADPFDERAYTVGNLLLDQEFLITRTFWQTLAAVRDVVDGPEVTSLPEREGHSISYTVELSLRLVP